jgi:hypothetical protein
MIFEILTLMLKFKNNGFTKSRQNRHPAKAGVRRYLKLLDSRFHGNNENRLLRFKLLEFIVIKLPLRRTIKGDGLKMTLT